MSDHGEDEGGLDYKTQAEEYKNSGNDAFKAGKWTEAVDWYTKAIDLDPDDRVYYSNRSAAFLKLGDAKSKALKDAEKCVELAPDWVKGYSRLGAAQHALRRFELAMDTYRAGLKLEPENTGLVAGLAAAREGQEAERKARWEAAKREREAEEAAAAAAEAAAEARKDADPLGAFLQEIKDNAPSRNEKVTLYQALSDKYTSQKMGTPAEQIARLLAPNYKWRNLNPFSVLQASRWLDVDATVEDIKQRYRKLSTLTHPDKNLDVPEARDAFEEVKKAYQMLLDEGRRQLAAATIEAVRHKVRKERQKKIEKGGVTEADLARQFGSFEAHCNKSCMKEFADQELRRREVEKHQLAQQKREHDQEEAEKVKLKRNMEHEKEWAEETRREERVGSWRDFQGSKGGGEAAAKKKAKMWKEEERAAEKPKYGDVEMNAWKKAWK
ncbi:unnamed protein product [Phaeothamnion confervicola]